MASIVANLPAPALLVPSRTTLFRTPQKGPVFPLKETQNRVAVVMKAAGESSESSSSLSIVKSVKNVWDSSEDRWAIGGLGFAAIVGVWASANLVSAVDKLPLIPSVLELIGILYSSWFIYRYLLFKPDREELFQIINKSVSSILGQ
ncbi:protein CURVATURE THYLAKOID 1C, chloroplastic [Ricinus communis]|uniref:Thylakoid membrane phosphoprotein 14 kDa, chloroplast, putative n=1 Tax=Ricinus communis TaxID=3988 RepID=B9RQK0_RICCO|nr:protein CURVATURE THYLAKOID 1C, chloroplastic [Ricinus communis]EEF46439.1 Thylakoid membrane phosphoprotein 14 kDa, chloroplast precursor, putative [Ricinus communis]|eukprot:XP_002516019.1 protein CURVATURE THYLAKOID 1C, chloroplastic [Ricinus communis]